MSQAYQVKAATAAQKETLTALGYTAQKTYWKAWTYDDAEKLIVERCAYLGIPTPGDKPLLLTAWQRAEVMLLSGYSVHPMPAGLVLRGERRQGDLPRLPRQRQSRLWLLLP